MDIIDYVSRVAGILGGFAGFCALFWEAWRHRAPNLQLFWSGFHGGFESGTNRPLLCAILRFSNYSHTPTTLHLETIFAEIYANNQWHKVEVLFGKPTDATIQTEWGPDVEAKAGVHEIENFKRFDQPMITYEQPLTRRLIVTHPDMNLLKNTTRISISIYDFHGREYKKEASIEEQRKKYNRRNIYQKT